MSFRINVVVPDKTGKIKVIYNLLENKGKAVESALRFAFQDPQWREEHLIKAEEEDFKELFNLIMKNSKKKSDESKKNEEKIVEKVEKIADKKEELTQAKEVEHEVEEEKKGNTYNL